jgi:hypothetical protein
MKIKIKDCDIFDYLSAEQLNCINNTPMSNQQNDIIEEARKGYSNAELDQMAKDHTKEILSQAVHATRLEYAGISLEEVAQILANELDQTELDVLHDKIYDILIAKYGRRKYE